MFKAIKKVAAPLFASTVTVLLLLAPGMAQAGVPGQVCNVDASPYGGANVYFDVSLSNPMYWLSNGSGFRITSYGNSITYLGHGNGQADGYFLRTSINQSSCH